MTDLQILVKQTSNPSILAMQKRLHEDVVKLGKQATEWKESCEALQLALEVERDAANLYAKQVAHWIGKHDALLEQQLATTSKEWNDENVIAWCVARGIKAAQPVREPEQTKQLVEKFDALQPQQESAPFGLDMPTPAVPPAAPAGWTEMVTVNLVREGVNKHKARELAQHFYMLAAAPNGVV